MTTSQAERIELIKILGDKAIDKMNTLEDEMRSLRKQAEDTNHKFEEVRDVINSLREQLYLFE